MVAGEFYIEHIAATIDFIDSHFGTVTIRPCRLFRKIVHQTSLESSGQYFIFIFDKDFYAFVFQKIYSS